MNEGPIYWGVGRLNFHHGDACQGYPLIALWESAIVSVHFVINLFTALHEMKEHDLINFILRK